MSEKKKFSVFIACEDAQHICDKSQYKESTLLEKIKLSIHLIFCRACQKYTVKNSKLTKLMQKDSSTAEYFNNNEKNELEKLFEQKIKQAEQQ